MPQQKVRCPDWAYAPTGMETTNTDWAELDSDATERSPVKTVLHEMSRRTVGIEALDTRRPYDKLFPMTANIRCSNGSTDSRL